MNGWDGSGMFDEQGYIYIALGNTYDRRGALKEKGFKFNGSFGWYSTDPKDEDCAKVPMTDLVDFCEGAPYFKSNLKEILDSYRYAGVESADFVGGIGERLRNIKVVITKTFLYKGGFPKMYYQFADEENHIFVWWSTNLELGYNCGDELSLTGTVKDHNNYQGLKQTVLTRCILKEVQE